MDRTPGDRAGEPGGHVALSTKDYAGSGFPATMTSRKWSVQDRVRAHVLLGAARRCARELNRVQRARNGGAQKQAMQSAARRSAE